MSYWKLSALLQVRAATLSLTPLSGGLGAGVFALECHLSVPWSWLGAVISVPRAPPALCSLCSRAQPSSSCQAPRGGERPLKRRAWSASLKCWLLAESPVSPAWCVRVTPTLRLQPQQSKAGRVALKTQGVQPSFFPAGEGFWGAVSRIDPFGRIRANILQKWDLDIFEH